MEVRSRHIALIWELKSTYSTSCKVATLNKERWEGNIQMDFTDTGLRMAGE
jgi:hypothetical protein